MTKVLPYGRGNVRQDTYYNCGPASTQTVLLSATGRLVPESTLARELGTTVNGTDWIGQITRVLNRRLPAAKYATVEMPHDPPRPDQVERLWRDIVRSVDAGYGVVVNIVAPPSNYPRAVAPSTVSPAYRGGTVYHYVAAMGYAGEGRGRRVWIADSGFAPYGYWVSLAQLGTLIPPKGYACATARALVPAPAPRRPAPQGGPVERFTWDWAHKFGFGKARPTSNIQAIFVHTTENALSASAQSVAKWQADSQSGSYHVLVQRDGATLRENTDNWMAWSAGPTANWRGLHISCVARARMSRAEWLREDKMLRSVANQIAVWSRRYNIPLVRISAAEVRHGKRGVCGHSEASAAWRESDHTDPGNGFPFDVVLAYARAILSPPKKAIPAKRIAAPNGDKVDDMELNKIVRSIVPGSTFKAPLKDFILTADSQAYAARQAAEANQKTLEKVLAELVKLNENRSAAK